MEEPEVQVCHDLVLERAVAFPLELGQERAEEIRVKNPDRAALDGFGELTKRPADKVKFVVVSREGVIGQAR
jgi:hypothetical protein